MSEVPSAYTKDAERVRESFQVSGGVGACSVGAGGSPAASIEAPAGPMWCHGAAPQQAAASRGDCKTSFTETG